MSFRYAGPFLASCTALAVAGSLASACGDSGSTAATSTVASSSSSSSTGTGGGSSGTTGSGGAGGKAGSDVTVSPFTRTPIYFTGDDNKRTVDASASFPKDGTFQKIILHLSLDCPN